ncbi:ATP-dependent zinc metalloprotease FtsH [Dissostichus eleginoides]|uniref:ATP-dependent zinc metalloprotease FtsH n=1 Tax=Dissostichus eleginoides TaxID=100907 RepID=A0AAD9EVL3_DISEL|nr:ATP-dependent zinc metalloprotease FtsH [Dissostichus eleginoides]
MPVRPPYVFPALVVVGHVVTLILAWQWRVQKKQGKKTHRREAHFKRNNCAFRRADQSFFSVQIASCRLLSSVDPAPLCCVFVAHTPSPLFLTPPSFWDWVSCGMDVLRLTL